MTERSLELSLLLPRAAECGGCVDEMGRELLRLDGIHGVETDVPRGLISVRFDEEALKGDAVETFARRAGAQAHCEDHCPLATHEHGPLDLLRPLPGEDAGERRILHVTGMDCADCAVKLQGALRKERGVRSADVNFGAATLAVAIDPSQAGLPDVFRAVRRLGYDTVERRARRRAAGRFSRRRCRRTRRTRLLADGAASHRHPASPARSPPSASPRPPPRPPRRPGSSAPPSSAAAPTWHAPPPSACARARST